MKPTITVNQYPIGWEWLDRVPLEDFTWLIEIFSTMTDNTDTYDFAIFDKEATNGEPPYPVIEINRKGLAHFMNEDQGYKHTHPPNKQNKVYHLTANNPNPIHLIANPGILHI